MELKIGAVFCNTYPPAVAVWCNNNNAHIEEIPAKQWHPRRFRIVANGAPGVEETKRMYEDAVQAHLNAVAQERGYDNCYTCISYINSTNSTFKREACNYNAWRDAVWMKAHEILDDFLAGKRTQPSVKEVIAELPEMDWDL